MILHLLRLFIQLEAHHTYSGEQKDYDCEHPYDPRPNKPTFTMMTMAMMLLRVRLRHVAP